MLCSICTTKGENMSFCNLFNTFGNSCGCNNCGCNSCNSCCCRRISTNTIPRPPIIPTPPPTISSIGTYNATTGEIDTGGILPLGTQYIQTGTGATYSVADNSITLSGGVYRVSYNTSATGIEGTAFLTLYGNGSPLPQSTSTTSLAAATDIGLLQSTIIIDAQTTPVTLTLVNTGEATTIFNNLAVAVTQIR